MKENARAFTETNACLCSTLVLKSTQCTEKVEKCTARTVYRPYTNINKSETGNCDTKKVPGQILSIAKLNN